MLEAIILGIIQGIAEWLPISSEGIIVLVEVNIFGADFESAVRYALFLHLGTFLAALIYFRNDVKKIIAAFFKYSRSGAEDKNLVRFLLITTLLGGIVGFGLLLLAGDFIERFADGTRIITLVIGFLLLITAWLQFRSKKDGLRGAGELNDTDSIILGLLQAGSALPGLSRSGLTVSGLLLRKIQDVDALRVSFLMSLPIVLGGNIFLNLNRIELSAENMIALVFAFVFGLLTIHGLMELARKINFAYFVLIFGLLVIISVFVV